MATVLDARPDVLGEDWIARTIPLPPDDEGEVVATLVSAAAGPTQRRAVLYLHGYVDYFFQAEHARHWIAHGYDFYALDLRKYGRSLLPHQTPNDIADLRAYGAEIAGAVEVVRAEHGPEVPIVLLGHSTGGLVAALWAHGHPGAVAAVVLNSPWFELNRTWFEREVFARFSDVVATVWPRLRVGHLAPFYGQALHNASGGAWDYDLAWKPHEGFRVSAGWLRAVRRGQARAKAGLAIDVPVLVCASARSGPYRKTSSAVADADCVLGVEHMVRYGPGLGADVTIARIDGGIHDLALSAPGPRETYESTVFAWLETALDRPTAGSTTRSA